MKQTAKTRMLRRVATFRDLEKAFLREREKFVFVETPCALFTALEGYERWGSWRLLPNGPDLEECWAEFDLLAANAIEAIGVLPVRHPTALQFDSNWSRKSNPAGRSAVPESTIAWLDFLRTEWVKRKREEFEFNTLNDIWAASATQCKLLARDCNVAAYQDDIEHPDDGEQVRQTGMSEENTNGVMYERLALPEFTGPERRKLNTRRAKARVILGEELQLCWALCFEISDGVPGRWRAAEPDRFFPPFATYGVAMYECLAEILLDRKPSLQVYAGWLNYAAKTHICECELIAAGSSSTDLSKCSLRLPASDSSVWEEMIVHSWQVFNHPTKSISDNRVQALIRAMEEPLIQKRTSLLGSIQSAVSQKTPVWLARGVESLEEAPPGTDAGERLPAGECDIEEAAIPVPGVLPDLPQTVASDLDKTWLALLNVFSLTERHIRECEDKRAQFRQSAEAVRNSPRSISGSWQVDEEFADSLGVAASCSLATAWFSSLALAYWGLLSSTWRHLFPTWTEKVEGRVLLDVANIWEAGNQDSESWFSIVCAPAVKAALRPRVLNANSFTTVTDPTKLQNRLKTFGFRDSPKSEGQSYRKRPNSCYYFDRTEVEGLTASSRNAIVAGLLEIHSACLEGSHAETAGEPPGTVPLRKAFDCFAEAFQNSSVLTSESVDAIIPVLVFDACACGTWTAPIMVSPGQNDTTPIRYGHEWTCQESLGIFNRLIDSRKVFWRAQMARQTVERSIVAVDSDRSRFEADRRENLRIHPDQISSHPLSEPVPISKKRGRPVEIETATKEAALTARARGASWKDTAKVLYKTTYPSRSQIKNACNVLKHFTENR